MKITDKQAERLFSLVKKICETHKRFRRTELNLDDYALIEEIEASNKPEPIRWCVKHGSKAHASPIIKCLSQDPMSSCEIWLFEPKERSK